MEFSTSELSHKLDSIEIIREIDPAAFFIEDGRL